ncbi:MAG: MFS transporter [Desulfobulbaceae bacterium]
MKFGSRQTIDSPVRGDRRVIFGWAMYDWANSAYSTTIAVAILPMYFAGVVVPAGGYRIGPTLFAAETLWGFMVSAAGFIVFALAPLLGAIADFCSAKKRFLFAFCIPGVIAAALLAGCGRGDVWLTIVLFVLSQVGFVGANVFYDAFLPQIAEQGERDRISSKGFAYGYAGGGLQFALALGLIAGHDALGLTEAGAARIGMLTAALWWGGFALLTARYLREPLTVSSLPPLLRPTPAGYLALGFTRVWRTLWQVGRLRHLALFLLAFLVYSEGIQTVIHMATMYGKQELRLPATALMVTLLLVQIVGIFGALLFARIAASVGSKRAVMLSLAVWSGVVIYAYFIRTAGAYFVLGAFVGLVLGGSQAISRSLYASMVPADAPAEFFGFYSVVNKFSAVGGPFLFALIRHWTGSSRHALLAVIAFFVMGILLLSMVDEEKARARGEEV